MERMIFDSLWERSVTAFLDLLLLPGSRANSPFVGYFFHMPTGYSMGESDKDGDS